jgi:polyisoprenyl-phosphate glycosyltransferase
MRQDIDVFGLNSLSIVCPVYNEVSNIPHLYERLTAALHGFSGTLELIFVNDGSSDDSLGLLKILHERDARVKIVNLSRNFGHQTAICAGLDFASGDRVVVMDSDLQDPPEVLPALLEKHAEGFDVVYAVRKHRKESLCKRLAYAGFYRLLQRVAPIEIPIDSGDFCVMSRKALNALRAMPERNRFIRGLRSWVGLKQIGVEYNREQRHGGEAKYTYGKLLKLAMDGFVSFSYLPLRIASFIGIVMSLLSFLGIIGIFYIKFCTNATVDVPGWASVVACILLIGGIQLLSLGIIGEYIGRIYDEVKQRPLYFLDNVIGFEDCSVPEHPDEHCNHQ